MLLNRIKSLLTVKTSSAKLLKVFVFFIFYGFLFEMYLNTGIPLIILQFIIANIFKVSFYYALYDSVTEALIVYFIETLENTVFYFRYYFPDRAPTMSVMLITGIIGSLFIATDFEKVSWLDK